MSWAALLPRALLVLLFLPFSALDKVVDFRSAVAQAREVCRPRWLAVAAIGAGLAVEVLGSLTILTGVGDRIGALVLAAYCVATAVLFKRFWAHPAWLRDPAGQGRTLAWDFLKNLSLAGGFLLLVTGVDGSGLAHFLHDPLASSLRSLP